jgi:hypothetical protein
MENDDNLSVEEAAKIAFLKSQQAKEKKDSLTILDENNVSKSDLMDTLSLLETKLKSLKKIESSDGIDLSELKKRVISDIDRVKQKIKKLPRE